MEGRSFHGPDGHEITAVTAEEMQEVDRVAVEDIGLQLLQMMENAGRVLAWHARAMRDEREDVLVVAGNGGNGGGGLACARHLVNRDITVQILLDRPPEDLTGAAAHQYGILDEMSVPSTTDERELSRPGASTVIIDALIGYGLRGEVRPSAKDYIDSMKNGPGSILSLDVPAGLDATTGEIHGSAVRPDRTLTLALPKTGLDAAAGSLYLADIGIPGTVYDRLDIAYENPFKDHDWIELNR